MEELRAVTEERDAAYREIARLRSELAREETSAVVANDEGASRIELCAFCDGEGVYWVHDFEMQCKRCNGTGSVPKGAGSLAPERH